MRPFRWRGLLLTVLAAALMLVLLISGCGGPRVNYALPKDLCSLPVSQDLIRPFFPPGDQVEFAIGRVQHIRSQ